jgi:hemolysin activation/secretion protein
LIDLNGLERSLALLNDMPGNVVSGELSAGDQEETSNIQLNAKDTGLVAGRAEVSNYGASNTGVRQVSGNLSLNNPSGNGDQVTLDVIGSQGSVYGQLKYTMPPGVDGWRLTAGLSTLDYKGLNSFSSVVTEGTAQTYGLFATYALERKGNSN